MNAINGYPPDSPQARLQQLVTGPDLDNEFTDPGGAGGFTVEGLEALLAKEKVLQDEIEAAKLAEQQIGSAPITDQASLLAEPSAGELGLAPPPIGGGGEPVVPGPVQPPVTAAPPPPIPNQGVGLNLATDEAAPTIPVPAPSPTQGGLPPDLAAEVMKEELASQAAASLPQGQVPPILPDNDASSHIASPFPPDTGPEIIPGNIGPTTLPTEAITADGEVIPVPLPLEESRRNSAELSEQQFPTTNDPEIVTGPVEEGTATDLPQSLDQARYGELEGLDPNLREMILGPLRYDGIEPEAPVEDEQGLIDLLIEKLGGLDDALTKPALLKMFEGLFSSVDGTADADVRKPTSKLPVPRELPHETMLKNQARDKANANPSSSVRR
jgi:hypothetical protein